MGRTHVQSRKRANCQGEAVFLGGNGFGGWRARQESNLWPSAREADALLEERVRIEQDPHYLPSHCFISSSRSGSKKASVILILPFMAPNFRPPRGL